MNQIDLAGRKAIVTGGAQGIGRAISERLLRSGASVACGTRTRRLEEARRTREPGAGRPGGGRRHPAAEVEAAVAATVGRWAGSTSWSATPASPGRPCAVGLPARRLAARLDIDLTGVFHCLRAVVPLMIAQNYGRICQPPRSPARKATPTPAPTAPPRPGSSRYQVAGQGARRRTTSRSTASPRPPPAPGSSSRSARSTSTTCWRKIPRGRFVKVDEIAAMVAWLVSAENSFTTGAVFDLSGGRATY